MSNGPRRRIREAVVQFLYASGPNPGPTTAWDDASGEELLSLLLEPLREKALRARSKALVHLQQGRTEAAAPLADLRHRLAKLDLTGEEKEFSAAVHALGSAEEGIAEALEHLRHELNGNKSPQRLEAELEAARGANRKGRTAAAQISSADPAFPAFQEIRMECLELWKNLVPFFDRLDLALARELAERPELRAVRRAEEDVTASSARISEYLSGLRAHLPEIDRQLATVIANYSPERIDRVDRSILRLATYELLFDSEIPPRVAINEAIELARSFGTTESPRFVNGVLDRLARERAEES